MSLEPVGMGANQRAAGAPYGIQAVSHGYDMPMQSDGAFLPDTQELHKPKNNKAA